MKRHFLAAAVVASVLAISAPASASAVDYPGNSVTTVGAPGATIVISALQTEQAAGTEAVIIFSPVDPAIVAILPEATKVLVGSGGFLNASVVIPKNAQPGQTFSVAVTAGNYSTTVPVTVATTLVADVKPTTVAAPFNSMPTIWFGAGLLLVITAFAATTVHTRRHRA